MGAKKLSADGLRLALDFMKGTSGMVESKPVREAGTALSDHITALEAEIAERDALIREMAKQQQGYDSGINRLYCIYCNGNDRNLPHDPLCPITEARDKGILTP